MIPSSLAKSRSSSRPSQFWTDNAGNYLGESLNPLKRVFEAIGRSFASEGDGGGVTDNVDAANVLVGRQDGAANLFEDVLEGVELEVGVILEVFLGGSVVPAGISAVVDVGNGLGERVDGEGGSTIEEDVVEGD